MQIAANSDPENLSLRLINPISLASSSKNTGVTYRCNYSANGNNSS
jgi:hypothetical protein